MAIYIVSVIYKYHFAYRGEYPEWDTFEVQANDKESARNQALKEGRQFITEELELGEELEDIEIVTSYGPFISDTPAPVYPTTCPECGSDNVNYDEIQVGDPYTSQEAFCQDCDCEWWEFYRYEKTDIYLHGNTYKEAQDANANDPLEAA